MARFERRRRREARTAHEPDPWLDGPTPTDARDDDGPALPGPRESDPRPATRSASPALWAPQRPAPDVDDVDDDPVTDPFGFPPVPPVVGAVPVAPDPAPTWAAWVSATSRDRLFDDPSRPPRDTGRDGTGPDIRTADDRATTYVPASAAPVRDGPSGGSRDTASASAGPGAGELLPGPDGGDGPGSESGPDATAGSGEPIEASPVPGRLGEPLPDPAEAAALAGAFAADYLSWDEDDPARRGRALADHLPGRPADRALLGWSGQGRQRAEIVLPGAVRPDDEGRLLVDVRVRVTPYRRVSRSDAAPEPETGEALGAVAAAPPVTARGWRGLAARWVRLVVTVARDSDRLVVDAGEETVGEDTAAEPSVRRAALRRVTDDPTLDGDDTGVPAGSAR